MGVLKRLPMIGKDLLEDTPVSRGCCQHRIAPSGGDTMVTVQRLYHTLPAQSTPSSAFIGHPPTTAITAYISITKNENSYAIEIQEGWSVFPTRIRRCIVSRRVVVQRCLRRCALERKAGPKQLRGIHGAVWFPRQPSLVNSTVQRTACRARDA